MIEEAVEVVGAVSWIAKTEQALARGSWVN
jgi:hypothetical protein